MLSMPSHKRRLSPIFGKSTSSKVFCIILDMDVTCDGPLKIAIVFSTLYKVVLWFCKGERNHVCLYGTYCFNVLFNDKTQHLYPYNPYNWKNIIIMLLKLLFSFTYVVKGRMKPRWLCIDG